MKFYSKEHLINILVNNLGFETYIDDFLGKIVVMDNYDAYKYAVITGHGYLDISQPELRVIIRRDMYRVLNQVFQYEMQFGLFQYGRLDFFTSAQSHVYQYPFIATGSYKNLVFVEYDEIIIDGEPDLYKKLYNIHNYILSKKERPSDYLVCPIRKGKLKDFEPFFEYVISEIYNRNGYVTDTQIPFFYGVGTPDLAAYSMKEEVELVQNYVGVSGFSIFELMTLKLPFTKERFRRTSVKILPESIATVFEVKTGSINGSQIIKYINENIFFDAYEIIPHKNACSEYAGLIAFNNHGNIVFENNGENRVDHTKQLAYFEWLKDYMKLYILANMTSSEFNNYKKCNKLDSSEKLIKLIRNTSLERILEDIM